jgi:hypothetical protein
MAVAIPAPRQGRPPPPSGFLPFTLFSFFDAEHPVDFPENQKVIGDVFRFSV